MVVFKCVNSCLIQTLTTEEFFSDPLQLALHEKRVDQEQDRDGSFYRFWCGESAGDISRGTHIGGFHKWGTPLAGWFWEGNPTKMDDFGVPPFIETSISSKFHHCWSLLQRIPRLSPTYPKGKDFLLTQINAQNISKPRRIETSTIRSHTWDLEDTLLQDVRMFFYILRMISLYVLLVLRLFWWSL